MCGPEETDQKTVQWTVFPSAIQFAAQLHAAQLRKSTTIPYLSHLMSVSALVMEYGGDEDCCIAALLHDSIEDQAEDYPGGAPALSAYIEQQFGSRVRAVVEGCTDTDTFPKPPWAERKRAYIAHLSQAGADTRLVSCCDKLHNASCIVRDAHRHGAAVFDRFAASREQTLWYYQSLADGFAALQTPPAAEFQRVVAQMKAAA
jgi:(p)ppGpp synthase/HD superfamily hydrolase